MNGKKIICASLLMCVVLAVVQSSVGAMCPLGECLSDGSWSGRESDKFDRGVGYLGLDSSMGVAIRMLDRHLVWGTSNEVRKLVKREYAVESLYSQDMVIMKNSSTQHAKHTYIKSGCMGRSLTFKQFKGYDNDFASHITENSIENNCFADNPIKRSSELSIEASKFDQALQNARHIPTHSTGFVSMSRQNRRDKIVVYKMTQADCSRRLNLAVMLRKCPEAALNNAATDKSEMPYIIEKDNICTDSSLGLAENASDSTPFPDARLMPALDNSIPVYNPVSTRQYKSSNNVVKRVSESSNMQLRLIRRVFGDSEISDKSNKHRAHLLLPATCQREESTQLTHVQSNFVAAYQTFRRNRNHHLKLDPQVFHFPGYQLQ